MSEGKKSVVNRGKRILTLKPGPDGQPRTLEPGKAIDCLDEAEFKLLTRYHDIADAEKVVPQLAARETALKKQYADLEAENNKLRQQLEETQTEQEPEPAKAKRKKEK